MRIPSSTQMKSAKDATSYTKFVIFRFRGHWPKRADKLISRSLVSGKKTSASMTNYRQVFRHSSYTRYCGQEKSAVNRFPVH